MDLDWTASFSLYSYSVRYREKEWGEEEKSEPKETTKHEVKAEEFLL